MMLTSKPIPAEAGAKLGLIDALVSSAQLLDTACQLALGIAAGVKPRNQVGCIPSAVMHEEMHRHPCTLARSLLLHAACLCCSEPEFSDLDKG